MKENITKLSPSVLLLMAVLAKSPRERRQINRELDRRAR